MKKVFGMTKALWKSLVVTCFVLFVMTVAVRAGYSLPLTVEAEDCVLGNGAVVATDVYGTEYPGYTGDGFVWVTNAGTITLEVDVPENAMYEVSTKCWMYLGDLGETRLQSISINGEPKGDFYIPNKGDWADFSLGYHYLEKGKATIEIGSSGSWGYILYDTVSFGYADMPDYTIDPTPCDADATDETKALKQYLTSVYGNYVISGQQEIYGSGNDGNYELEFDYIYEKTGKYPALRGFDMMNYNPLYGWEDGTTERIINWAKTRGGIATVCWHINVPADFNSYTLGESLDWTDCTYKPTDSFNTANCIDNSTKEYAYLMLIIEDLAEQLLKLQDANVPVILRPFHEAEGYNNIDGSGAWFWWGSGGAEVYKELWKLLYTELTETYGVHNALWEVNLYTYANSNQWYPGDDYVDLVAYDKYEGSPYTWETSAATTVFLALVDATNDTKMVAMSENDIIPDIQNIVNEGAWWLYFCPWYGDFILSSSNNDPALLNTIYNSQYVLTLDEMPADLYGYVQNDLPAASITSPADGATFTVGDSITITADASDSDGEVKLVEFYADGMKLGEDSTAPYSITWDDAATGTYAVTAKVTDDKNAAVTSAAVSITVNPGEENVPPTASITSPADGDIFTAGDTITISVDATDSDGEVISVEFYVNDEKLAEDTTAPYSITWNTSVTGTFAITAKVTDDQNATTVSTAVTVTINPIGENVPPTASITGPADGASFTVYDDITISANASDSDGEVALVEFYVDGVKIGEDSVAPYSIIWDSADVGTYAITVRATDNEGAVSTSTAVTISVSNGGTDYEEITVPFSKDGSGDLYWKTTDTPGYINSWCLDLLEVNGVDLTNTWKSGADLPAKQDGYYYIHYKGSFSWSHFELK